MFYLSKIGFLSAVMNEFSSEKHPLLDQEHPAFRQLLIEKTESLIQRRRWKAFFFLSTNTDDTTTKETYGFKSKRSPLHVKELDEFEDLIWYNAFNLKRITIKTTSRTNSETTSKRSERTSTVLLRPDKTTCFYKTRPKDYMRLLIMNKNRYAVRTRSDIRYMDIIIKSVCI